MGHRGGECWDIRWGYLLRFFYFRFKFFWLVSSFSKKKRHERQKRGMDELLILLPT